MKKMYKQPEIETAEVLSSTVLLTGSTVVNNTDLTGGSEGDPIIAY